MSNYRHFVISPLTDKQPVKTNEFVVAPLLDERGILPEQKPRSMTSRIIWSFLIVMLSTLFLWVTLSGLPFDGSIDSRRFWASISRSNFGVFLSYLA